MKKEETNTLGKLLPELVIQVRLSREKANVFPSHYEGIFMTVVPFMKHFCGANSKDLMAFSFNLMGMLWGPHISCLEITELCSIHLIS